MLDNERFQRENFFEAYQRLGLHPKKPELKPPLMKDVILQVHQVVGVNWMLEMERSLAGGGLLADVLSPKFLFSKISADRI